MTSSIWVYSDNENLGAPIRETGEYRSDKCHCAQLVLLFHADEVATLVVITADFKRIPTTAFPTKLGADHQLYYVLHYEIEITYYSAYTKYELIYDGVNYGPVAAEYV